MINWWIGSVLWNIWDPRIWGIVTWGKVGKYELKFPGSWSVFIFSGQKKPFPRLVNDISDFKKIAVMFKLRKWIIRSKKNMFSGHISHGIRYRKNGSRNLAVWVLSPEAEVRRKIPPGGTAEMLGRLEPKLRVKKISEHQTWPEIGNSWISGKKSAVLWLFFWGGSFQLLLFGKGDKFEDKCLLSLFRCIYIYRLQ